MKGTVEKVIWLSNLSGLIGIVIYTNEDGVRSVRVNSVEGDDEQADIKRIVELGAKIQREDVKAMAVHMRTFKPPIGVMPKWLAEEKRYKELTEAIERYEEAGLTPGQEWIDEAQELLKGIQKRQKEATERQIQLVQKEAEEFLKPKDGDVECSRCGKKFLNTEFLKEHYDKVHGKR